MSASDSRSVLIDRLGQSSDNFNLSNVILPKAKSLKALQLMERLREDLLNFAVDPTAAPTLPVPPVEPNYDGLSPKDAQERYQDYKKKLLMWVLVKDAHNRKVPLDKYLMIQSYFRPYEITIEGTSAVKGKRFHSFTRTIDSPKPQGLFGKLLGGGNDE